jgi:hypothetical protein
MNKAGTTDSETRPERLLAPDSPKAPRAAAGASRLSVEENKRLPKRPCRSPELDQGGV